MHMGTFTHWNTHIPVDARSHKWWHKWPHYQHSSSTLLVDGKVGEIFAFLLRGCCPTTPCQFWTATLRGEVKNPTVLESKSITIYGNSDADFPTIPSWRFSIVFHSISDSESQRDSSLTNEWREFKRGVSSRLRGARFIESVFSLTPKQTDNASCETFETLIAGLVTKSLPLQHEAHYAHSFLRRIRKLTCSTSTAAVHFALQ